MGISRLFAVAVVVALSSGCQPTPAPASSDSPYRPTASVREIMQSVVEPGAQGLWEAVGTISNAEGTVNLEPSTDEEWEAVRRHGITVIEATNLLLVPGRHVAPPGAGTLYADEADPGAELPPAEIEERVLADWDAWTTMVGALHDSAVAVLETIDAKDADALLTTGSDLDAVCEACHTTFWYPSPESPVGEISQ